MNDDGLHLADLIISRGIPDKHDTDTDVGFGALGRRALEDCRDGTFRVGRGSDSPCAPRQRHRSPLVKSRSRREEVLGQRVVREEGEGDPRTRWAEDHGSDSIVTEAGDGDVVDRVQYVAHANLATCLGWTSGENLHQRRYRAVQEPLKR